VGAEEGCFTGKWLGAIVGDRVGFSVNRRGVSVVAGEKDGSLNG